MARALRYMQARCRPVRPSLVLWCRLAPAYSRVRTMSAWPAQQAQDRAV